MQVLGGRSSVLVQADDAEIAPCDQWSPTPTLLTSKGRYCPSDTSP